MPIVVTLYVENITSILTSYDSIKVYRSSYEDGVFLEVTTDSTRPVLTSSAAYYNFEDVSGTPSSWYKTSYYNTSTLEESGLSTAMHGIEVEREHITSTYPAEISLTSTDSYNIDAIRYYIGDEKKVLRDYISPQCLAGYESVSSDGTTYETASRGWPLKIIKDSYEYTSSSNPYVTDYKYITFSGTQISTATGTLDMWYESFRHSDREILKVYSASVPPPYVSTVNFSSEMNRIVAAITILESEIAQLMGETSGSFNLQGELSYNPEPLLRQKQEFLKRLKDKLDELTDELTAAVIEGVRID